MNDFVRDMHTRSGLINEIVTTEGAHILATRDALEDAILSLPVHDTLHLAGFSIHFDTDWLEHEGFKRLFDMLFHHRMLDLSALKLAWQNAGVDFPIAENPGKHRALNDVDESIAQARIFRDLIKGESA